MHVQKDYKTFSPSVDWDSVDWESAPAIQETNVQSAICDPKPGDVLEGPLGEIEVSMAPTLPQDETLQIAMCDQEPGHMPGGLCEDSGQARSTAFEVATC